MSPGNHPAPIIPLPIIPPVATGNRISLLCHEEVEGDFMTRKGSHSESDL
jgi:hypothetical protein